MAAGIFNGKFKALTFSFDDGNLEDRRLVEIMNKYGLKGTFNLNSGLLNQNGGWNFKNIKTVKHMNYYDIGNLYVGHEIAGHSYNHPSLVDLSREDIVNQIKLDKKLLEFLFNQKIDGFAYPMGTFNEVVGEVLEENGIKYARTTVQTLDFSLPENPIFWNPTCHFRNENIEELAEKFLQLEGQNAVFYIWGHSYELLNDEDFEWFDSFCKKLSGRSDIAYLTNIQVINAFNK